MFQEKKMCKLPITSFANIKKLPEVVFFDYDGTIAVDKHLVKAFNYAVKQNFDKKKDKQFLKELNKVKKDSDKWAFIKKECSPEIFAKCNEDYDIFLSQQRICKVSGAVKLIKKLHKYGIDMYVISQKRGEGLREALKKGKLDMFFKGAYGTLDFGALQKPSKEFCDKIIETTKTKTKNKWIVGDRYSDVVMAINFGGNAFIIDKGEAEKIKTEQEKLIGEQIFFTSHWRLRRLIKKLRKQCDK